MRKRKCDFISLLALVAEDRLSSEYCRPRMGSHARDCVCRGRDATYFGSSSFPSSGLGTYFGKLCFGGVRVWPGSAAFHFSGVPSRTAGLHFGPATPSAKWSFQIVKMCIFLEEFDPFRQLCWRAEGGVAR